MNDFLSSFLNKISKKVSRRKTTKWNKNQIKLDLLKLEERLVPAPNLLVPSTTSGAPLGFVAGTNLAFSGALDIELLDTPTPTSTGSFTTTVAATAGTASATASGAAAVTGSGTNSLSISGSLADVNATLNSLTYTNSTTGAASLVVTARDSAGTPLTDTKTIFVNAANATLAPTITSALADVSYEAETATTPVARATIPVVVNDPQGATGVVVTTTNDNPALVNSISVTGTYPNFTLAISTKTGITGTAVVTVKVSDGTNFTTKSFKVTVTPNPYTLSVETLAGRTTSTGPTGYTDGTGAAATFTNPRGATADNRGLIYVQDGNLIRSINTSGVVTTLAGSTTTTTRVDGVGAAAGIATLSANDYTAMKVSPDDNWLYFMNGGWLRKMGINSSDSANYKKVISVVAFTGAPDGGGGLVFSSDGTKIFQVFNLKIKRFDLTNNTISDLNPDGNAANNVSAAWMVQGPNNTAFLRYHPGFGTTAYFGGLFRVDLNTGAFTRLANNPLNGDTMNGSPAYNPDTNEILVDTNGSNPKILDATTGALKYTLPASNATNIYTDGVGTSFDATDAITYFGGIYYLSQSGPGTTNAANIRAVKPAPGLFNPGSVTFTEGQTNYFDNFSLEKIGVSANGSASIAYTITALYGTLDVSTVSGLTGVIGRGTNSLSFTGSDANLNAALATLAYTPNTGFINATTAGTQITGAPLETLTATATGTSAGGIGMGTNTATTSVLVKALNNAPRIITPLANQDYVADTTQKTEPVINFTIADADTAASSFTNNATTGARITVTSSNPNLFLPASMVTAIGGSNNARTLTLKHEAGITGSATITITINDGTNQNTYTFRVTVTPNPYTLALFNLAGRTTSTGPTGYTDGTGAAATFTNPLGATADNRGLVYVQDNNLIRSISTTGVVTTLAGGTANTTRVDGVGTAAGIPGLSSTTYTAMKVSPDNNWLYFMNGGWLRKMGINPSDSANYKNVTSVMAFTGSPAGGGLVFSSDGTKIFQVFDYASNGKIKQFDLNTNTISNLNPDGNAANNVCAAWMVQGPNNTAFLRYHPGAGTTAYFGGLFSVNLATGAFTRLANNGVNADTFNGSPAYNPLTNEILVDTNSANPKILDATTGALKYTLPVTDRFLDGLSGGFDATDAITVFGGDYYLSQGGPAITNASNIRAVKPAPGLYNPGTQIFTEGQSNAFSNTDLQKMAVVANGSTSMTYTLTALYGTLDVSSVTGLTGVAGRGSKSLSFTGSEADINAALATLAYTPAAGFINATTLGVQITGTPLETLSASVTGSDANGPRGTNSASTGVLVRALNNNPRITTPLVDKTYLVEQAVSTETAINFNIADADTPVANFTNNGTTNARIVATSDNPNLILPADIALAIGGSAGARTLTIKHQANITGVANVTVTISDGTNQNTYTFKVTVLPSPSYYWDILAGSATGAQGFANATGTSAAKLLRILCNT